MDAEDEWINSAYDEEGNSVECDLCGGTMKWNGDEWECRECEQTMDRPTYFNHIGAQPPSPKCMKCKTNYPFCKKSCTLVTIDPNDPMLD